MYTTTKDRGESARASGPASFNHDRRGHAKDGTDSRRRRQRHSRFGGGRGRGDFQPQGARRVDDVRSQRRLLQPTPGTCICGCINCNGYSTAACVLASFSVAVNGTYQLAGKMTNYNGQVDDFTTGATWSSSSTSIATVGNGSSGGLTTGVSAGAMTITALMPTVPTTQDQCDIQLGCPTGRLQGTASGTVPSATITVNLGPP